MATGADGRPPTHDDDSYLEDKDEWPSPTRTKPRRIAGNTARSAPTSRNAESKASGNAESQDAREQSLREELASVRKVNEAIEGVLESLEKAKRNMKNVNQTVSAASSLLNVWTRILSQTEHNQRLIIDPTWHGVSQDLQNIEDETLARQQAAERKDAEDQERKAAAARKAEEEEKKKRAEAASKPKGTARGQRGLGRSGSTRTATSSNISVSSVSRGISSTRRSASGIGRGATRGTRGRG